tara:strand:- start:43 stop:1218 length:1176 start_codon:yes stop_codon:yes gene_type:complete
MMQAKSKVLPARNEMSVEALRRADLLGDLFLGDLDDAKLREVAEAFIGAGFGEILSVVLASRVTATLAQAAAHCRMHRRPSTSRCIPAYDLYSHAQALAQLNITMVFLPQRVLLNLIPGDALVFTRLQPWNPITWKPLPADALHLQAIRVPSRFDVPQHIIDAGGAVLQLDATTAAGFNPWLTQVTALGARVASNAQSLQVPVLASDTTVAAVAEVRGLVLYCSVWHALTHALKRPHALADRSTRGRAEGLRTGYRAARLVLLLPGAELIYTLHFIDIAHATAVYWQVGGVTGRILRAEGYSPEVDACNGPNHSAGKQLKDDLQPKAVYFQRCAAAVCAMHILPGTRHSLCSGLTITLRRSPQVCSRRRVGPLHAWRGWRELPCACRRDRR